MKEREKFGTRLGFILVSAGCAVGLGNVWKFPYICGENGGAAFIIIYLFFLLLLGFPIIMCEFAVGRASGVGTGMCFDKLEPKGGRWHRFKWGAIGGSYIFIPWLAAGCCIMLIKWPQGSCPDCRRTRSAERMTRCCKAREPWHSG